MPTFCTGVLRQHKRSKDGLLTILRKDCADTDAYETIECVACRAASVTMGVVNQRSGPRSY